MLCTWPLQLKQTVGCCLASLILSKGFYRLGRAVCVLAEEHDSVSLGQVLYPSSTIRYELPNGLTRDTSASLWHLCVRWFQRLFLDWIGNGRSSLFFCFSENEAFSCLGTRRFKASEPLNHFAHAQPVYKECWARARCPFDSETPFGEVENILCPGGVLKAVPPLKSSSISVRMARTCGRQWQLGKAENAETFALWTQSKIAVAAALIDN